MRSDDTRALGLAAVASARFPLSQGRPQGFAFDMVPAALILVSREGVEAVKQGLGFEGYTEQDLPLVRFHGLPFLARAQAGRLG